MKRQLAIIFMTLSLSLSGQRIIGYFPNYAYAATYNQIQYNKLTHLYYFSLNPHTNSDGSLWYNDSYSWFNSTNFSNVITAARAANPNIKIFIVTGGAPGSDGTLNTRLYNIATTPSKRNTFCNNILNFIKTNNLDGWDLDWEFPFDQANRDAHETLLSVMNTKLDSMSAADCRVYELTAAVGGGYTNRTHYNPVSQDYCNANVINYVDFIDIMTYDSPVNEGDGYTSQQQLEAMQNDLTRWVAEKGWSKSKLNLGVGFYNNSHGAFSAGGNNSSWYNMNYWPTGGSGCPNMKDKIDYIKTQGCGGVFIWHLMQDNLGAGTTPAMYSLLDCIYQYTTSSWGTWVAPGNPCCPFPNPGLGADQSICGTSSVTLNSGVATNAPSRTFTWKKDGVTQINNSTTATTYNITTAGTYEVIITEGSCTRNDVIVITGTLPVPVLGADQLICSTTSYNLIPSNTASFPAGTNWQWAEDVGSGYTNISGATSNTLSNIRKAAYYKLTASISGCASTNDIVQITSNLATPVDGCSSSAPVALNVTNPGLDAGPYTWFNVSTGGTSLHTGTTYNAPSAGTYYVQSGAAGVSGSVGGTGAFGAADMSGTIVNKKLAFTTNAANLTITSIDVYVDDWDAVTSLQIAIETSGGTLIGTTSAVSYSNSVGSPYKLTIPVNLLLASAGNYRMYFTGSSTGIVRLAQAGFPYTEGTNSISIPGTPPDSYKYFTNIQFSIGSACGRLPVIASISGSCSAPAPVRLLDFYSEIVERKVLLKWITASEKNNDHFLVERSVDGIRFNRIGKINGNGNSEIISHYEFEDASVTTGEYYYRLVQKDYDGTSTYSSVISETVNAVSLSLHPNPAQGNSVIIQCNADEIMSVSIYDLNGKPVIEIQEYIVGTEIHLTGKLPAGIYLVNIKNGKVNKTMKLIKE